MCSNINHRYKANHSLDLCINIVHGRSVRVSGGGGDKCLQKYVTENMFVSIF